MAIKKQKMLTPKLIKKELENIKKYKNTIPYPNMLDTMERIILNQIDILKRDLKITYSIKESFYIYKWLTNCRETLKMIHQMKEELQDD